jgi:hypothetical protein
MPHGAPESRSRPWRDAFFRRRLRRRSSVISICMA